MTNLKYYIEQLFLGNLHFKWKWILIALLLKGTMFLFHIKKNTNHQLEGFYGIVSGDTYSYIDPIDNLKLKGEYSPDFRMPGYGSLYLVVSSMFDKATTFNIIIVFQYVLASISVYYLALIAFLIFKKKRYFFMTFWIFAISMFTNYFDIYVLTDSLGCSLLVFSIYHFLRVYEKFNSLSLFYSGLLFAGVVFLRPVAIFLLILLAIFILIYSFKRIFPKMAILYFLVSFLILDGAWIIRNFSVHKKFIPLMTSAFYPEHENSFMKPTYSFVQSWGGSIIFWDPTAEITWFGIYISSDYNLAQAKENPVEIPDDIYTSAFNEDSLIKLKEELTFLYKNASIRDSLYIEKENKVKQKLAGYQQSIIDENPFLYYVKAPLRIMMKLFFHGANSPKGSTGFVFIYKSFYYLFYWLILFGTLIGTVLLFRKWFSFTPISFVLAIPIYIILVHSLILRMPEARYMVVAWPFMILITSFSLIEIFEFIRSKLSNR